MDAETIIDHAGQAFLKQQHAYGSDISGCKHWRDWSELLPRTGMRTDVGIALKRAGYNIGNERDIMRRIDSYANDLSWDESGWPIQGPKLQLVQDIKVLFDAVMKDIEGSDQRAYFSIPKPGYESPAMDLLVEKTAKLAQQLGLKQLPLGRAHS